MFLTNISLTLSRLVILEVNNYDKPIPSRIEKRENKNLDSKEAQVIVDNINYQKIPTYNYLKLTDCFNANPLYVKTIEALNDKKNAS